MAIMAAGSVAGSMAAQSIMGTPESYGPDTSVPGVGSATIKPGSKGNPAVKVPQVDISQSLKWLDMAAATQEASYLKGLGFYTQALKLASNEMESGFNKANAVLTPLSASSNAALNEQMKMMGMAPISTLKAWGTTQGLSASMVSEMDKADAIQDPTKRAEAKAAINAKLESQKVTGLQLVRQDARPADFVKKDFGLDSGLSSSYMGSDQYRVDNANALEYNTKGKADAIAAQAAYDASLLGKSTQAEIDAANAKNAIISEQQAGFNSQFTAEAGRGYTGAEVSAKVASTPGYQFQLEQGTQAIERQGAAAGMLGSGNTLIALQEFGQKQAQNYYGQYMDNLAQIVMEGSGATMQIAQNTANIGQGKAGYVQAGGAAFQQTQNAIGDAKAAAYNNKATIFADAAKFNATMQDTNINAAQNRSAQAQNTMASQASAFQNNALNQAKFNYQYAQNQQGGQQYFGSNQNQQGVRL